MNAVERVFQYSDEGSTSQEADYEDTHFTANPPQDWPAKGRVEFNNVFAR